MITSDLNIIIKHTLSAVNPYQLLKSSLFYKGGNVLCVGDREYKLQQNVKLIAAGKAVGGMVRAVQDLIGDHIIKGVVSLPQGYRDTFKHRLDLYPLSSPQLDIFEGGKDNLPDENSLTASRAIYQLADAAVANDLLIVLLSGGASALTSLPISGISIGEKRIICSSLSQRGASINELNTVRKHLSLLKGGKLAILSQPAQILTLILSDVINDPLDIIASGPCYPDSSTGSDFLTVLQKYQITNLLPQQLVHDILQKTYHHVDFIPPHFVIGNNKLALDAAVDCSRSLGYESSVLYSRVSGNVVEMSSYYSAIIFCYLLHAYPYTFQLMHETIERCFKVLGIVDGPTVEKLIKSYHEVVPVFHSKRVCLLSGGEPVVQVKGDGRGGRNQELALRVGINLDLIYTNMSFILDGMVPLEKFQEFWDSVSIEFCSLGTDGQDGPTPAAGARLTHRFMRENEGNRDFILSSLSRNGSYDLFSSLSPKEYLIHTELTGTNVMDIHLILISC